MIKWGVLFVFLSLYCFAMGAKLPSHFKICKRTDPDLNDCFAKAIQHVLPYLKEPIPELGLPSAEPVRIDSIIVEGGSSRSVNLTQKFYNIDMYKIINATIKKAEIKLGSQDVKIAVDIFNKLIKTEFDYETEGNVLLFPTSAKGKGYADFYDTEVPITVDGEFYEKKGKTYVKVTNVTLEYFPNLMKLQLDNLFNGDERLEKELNKLLNDNWKEILAEFKPGYQQGLSTYFKNAFGAVYDRVPYDELFPL